MNKKLLYWTLQIVGWSAYGLLNIFLAYFGENLSTQQIIVQLILVPFYICLTHIYRNFIIRNGWLKIIIQKLVVRVIIACFILSIINYGFLFGLSSLLGFLDPAFDLNPRVIFLNILAYLILFFLWSLVYFMYHYVENYNRSLKFDAAMNEIELNNLKSQLNPHFIFNALNSVRALVDEDPAKAKNSITQLSNILRNSLILDKKRLINFNDELNTVIDFLALEKIRYEERLTTEFVIHPESYKYQVPPLMIQTLVENGIKHGISNLTSGGKLSIETQLDDKKCLKISIRNSGNFKLDKRRKHKGFGIENTKQRLKLIFEKEASFSIKNEQEGVVLTTVKIPQISY
ncbi:histidine kinase [Marivirga tractuosa]|uniref:Signal transduction histidine kinase, LytS n=1 Tax=Marivirga tractuosa (strain ATCC 23168 / DSM 4126 / NBRC 15989 / NCIMB 1408 / VKM B-1430 / H-43) TaxID=643867 RepID=E4TNW3_MARTH|nr:histidine kinase [Marivirga tractuosa]ADR22527.1 signal transduction histidine kinase, LytS [Marivirga tractuosa DSM 4126]BDD16802.1 histidine kinase [Marivirga tractuosa]